MNDVKTLLAAHGQEHLVAHWDRLSPEDRERLAAQIRNVDFPLLTRLVRDDAKDTDWNAVAARAKSPRSIRLDVAANEISLDAALTCDGP